MQGKTQPAEQVIETFNGEHRFVLDYLRKEVFEKQAEETRAFLLHTCLFDRICGSLCDRLTGQAGSAAMLERLAQANLFVPPGCQRRAGLVPLPGPLRGSHAA